MGSPRFWIAAFALALPLACRSTAPPGVYFDSRPPGAEVVIDERRTGYVTPCLIALDRDKAFDVRLELAGFRPCELRLVPSDRVERVPWSDGALAPNGQFAPTALGSEAFFIPYVRSQGHAPGRVFVRLTPLANEPDSN